MLAIMDGYNGRSARSITTAPKTVPIGDYGFLSDGEALALVSPGGSVHWMCLPRTGLPERVWRASRPPRGQLPSSAGRRHGSGRSALPAGDDDFQTSWGTATGWIIVRDALWSVHGAMRQSSRTRTAAHRPTTTPSTSCYARSAASPAKFRRSANANRSTTTAAKRLTGPTPSTSTTRA